MNMAMRMELFVEDAMTSVNFYTRVLGFEKRSEDSDDSMGLHNGSVILRIARRTKLKPEHYFDQASFEHRKGLGVEFVLEVDDLDALYQRVQASGYEIREPLVDRYWGSRDFRVVDPDGYYLRITDSQLVADRLRDV